MEYLTRIPSKIVAATTSYFYEPAHANRERQNAETSRLLRLPAELRNEIYLLCLAPGDSRIFVPLDLGWAISQGPHAGLIRTCRSLRREVMPMFLHAGKLFSAAILDEDREWNTKAHAVITRFFTDTLGPCVPLKRVQLHIHSDCSVCHPYGAMQRSCINVELRGDGVPGTVTVNRGFQFSDVNDICMWQSLVLLPRLRNLIARVNCVDSCKEKSGSVEKRDVIDVMELIREIMREDRVRKGIRTGSCFVVFET